MGNGGEPARRPGGAPRLAALLATVLGFASVFTLGFPPAARDRLPILLVALALGLASAWNPARGLVAFSFLFPLSGVGDRAFGGADAIAWPVLLFAGFAAGWTFRFLYDFENTPDPSRLDKTLRALSAVWVVATIAAIARGRTLWALLHGLRLRAVNVEGLLDSAAIRDSVLSLAALASGVGFFFILRRSGAVLRERALRAALAGCGLSGACAVAERLGLPPGETSAFWRMTGRLSGGAIDPNALGLLSGLAFVAAAAWLLAAGVRRAAPIALAAGSAAGLVLSGSRSGLLLVTVGMLALVCAPRLPAARRLRLVFGLVAAAGILVIAGLLLQADRGGIARRLAYFMDPTLSLSDQASSRPLLWAGAVRLFGRYPIAGAGLGAYSWQLPTLLAEEGRSPAGPRQPGKRVSPGPRGDRSDRIPPGRRVRGPARSRVRGRAVGLEREAADRGLRRGVSRISRGARAGLALVRARRLARLLPLRGLRRADRVRRRNPPSPARSRRGAVLIYAAAAAAATLATLSPDEAFRYRRGMGFHGKEEDRGQALYWTQRRFAIRLPPGETLRMGLVHYTPEGRPVDLIAEADGREVLSRTIAPGQAIAAASLRRAAGAARVPLHALALVRAQAPGSLGGPARARRRGGVSRRLTLRASMEFQFHPSSGGGAVRRWKLRRPRTEGRDPRDRRRGDRRAFALGHRPGRRDPRPSREALGRSRPRDRLGPRGVRRGGGTRRGAGGPRAAMPRASSLGSRSCIGSRPRPGPGSSTRRPACSRPARRKHPPRDCRAFSSRWTEG